MFEPRVLVPVEIVNQRIALLALDRRLAFEDALGAEKRGVERRQLGGQRIVGVAIAILVESPLPCRIVIIDWRGGAPLPCCRFYFLISIERNVINP